MDPELSLVIPAYNESSRLPPYLQAIRAYLESSEVRHVEVIVVDDGSTDDMADVVSRMAATWPQLRLERHGTNRGKGAAVRRGVLAARGRLILFTDADGATPIREERKLRAAIDAGADLAIGSRRSGGDGVVRRHWHRKLVGGAFSLIVRGLLAIPAHDTQCGFKMFRRDAGHVLLGTCREDGYLFDLHVLSLAARMGYRVSEVSVDWSDVPGSKVRLLRDSCRMLRALLRLRRDVSRALWGGVGAIVAAGSSNEPVKN